MKTIQADPDKKLVLELVLRNGRVVWAGYEHGTGYHHREVNGFGYCETAKDLFISAKYCATNNKSAKARGIFAEAYNNGEGLTRCEIRQGEFGIEFRVGDAPFQLGPPGVQGKPIEQIRESNATMNPSLHFVIV
jgi:hypothetical protein